jgi:hypothetical protein
LRIISHGTPQRGFRTARPDPLSLHRIIPLHALSGSRCRVFLQQIQKMLKSLFFIERLFYLQKKSKKMLRNSKKDIAIWKQSTYNYDNLVGEVVAFCAPPHSRKARWAD